MFKSKILLSLIAILFLSTYVAIPVHATTPEECFPFETLSEDEAQEAESLLLKILDTEGLYTLVGELKPISSGFFLINSGTSEERESARKKARRIFSKFKCGESVEAHLLKFRYDHGARSFDQAFLFKVSAFQARVKQYAELFKEVGIEENSPRNEALQLIENHEDEQNRHRAYGYLFGYPKYAVDFFVEESQKTTEERKENGRKFIVVPTYDTKRNHFVWAAPKDYVETKVDEYIKKEASLILTKYKSLRSKHVDQNGRGAMKLVRDWFCQEGKGCDSSHAEY